MRFQARSPLRVKRRAPALARQFHAQPGRRAGPAGGPGLGLPVRAGEENAAGIGMEHNLGLTCDPVGGRVQVPCIERNAMGAVKAIHAARMALRGDGHHYVSLDQVIKTMRDTGADMKTQYKETPAAASPST